MRIYFATNRRYVDGGAPPFRDRYNVEGPAIYRVGFADVTKVAEPAEAPDDGFLIDAIHVEPEAPAATTGGVEFLGSSAIFHELTLKSRTQKRNVIVYIHGFNSSFETAIQRAAQLHDLWLDGDREPLVFPFSWPADGGDGFGFGQNGETAHKWKYFSDRDDAESSGKAIARSLRRLLDCLMELRKQDVATQTEPCEQCLHLVAHSMGNWALRHALLSLRGLISGARLPKIFTNAFLMAADEDADALEHKHKLGLLPQLADAVHVYHSKRDLALLISDTTKLNPDRLGSWGPRIVDGLDSNIYGIDCAAVSDTAEWKHGRHQYYRLRPEVIADVRQVIAGRAPDEIAGRKPVRPGRLYRIEPAT